jgi:hypothetical protein
MAMAMAVVVQAMAEDPAAGVVVVQCKHKITQKCGFFATFFWLTNKSHFAIILV